MLVALFRNALIALAMFLPLCGCGLLAKDTDKGSAAADAQSNEEPAWQGAPVPYKVKFRVKDGPESLSGKMKAVSQLEQLAKEPPDSLLALERRARLDQDTAVKLLQSECYYDGSASVSIDENTRPATVTITLEPGPQFSVGRADVIYDPKPEIPEAFLHRSRPTGFFGLEMETLPPPEFPAQIPGVEPGKPILAKDMLTAVEKIPQELVRTGYPLAKITSSLYTLNKPEKKLNAEITIDPGPPAYMGEIIPTGNTDVNTSYLKKLVPWTPGKEPWNDQLLQNYANSLRSTGLFRTVEVKPGKPGGNTAVPALPIEVELVEGPKRSLSASARYDSDTGFGVEGTWEHSNVFHNGEKLVLDAPISQQESGLKAHFEKPAFVDRRQRFLADAAALWENTDAYQQHFVRGGASLERHLGRGLTAGLSMSAETGYLKDNEHEEQAYSVISPGGGFRYDGRNNKFNPSKGVLIDFKLKPFTGYYEEEFHAFAGVLNAAAWYAPLGKKPDGSIDDTVVLAGRWEMGAMPGGTELYTIPSSLRYFAGGAGTVRGYSYQAIGPRDSEGDPLGGRSYQVVNFEARFMVAENIGIVPFLDGGMVYRDEWPEIFGDMDWGAGLGFRYYTPIGPVRFDVATPLTQIDDDPPIQFYISIGQSF